MKHFVLKCTCGILVQTSVKGFAHVVRHGYACYTHEELKLSFGGLRSLLLKHGRTNGSRGERGKTNNLSEKQNPIYRTHISWRLFNPIGHELTIESLAEASKAS